ncbi:hypothetical protein IAU59_003876 [Kwoniella sp. CBS 9459]
MNTLINTPGMSVEQCKKQFAEDQSKGVDLTRLTPGSAREDLRSSGNDSVWSSLFGQRSSKGLTKRTPSGNMISTYKGKDGSTAFRLQLNKGLKDSSAQTADATGAGEGEHQGADGYTASKSESQYEYLQESRAPTAEEDREEEEEGEVNLSASTEEDHPSTASAGASSQRLEESTPRFDEETATYGSSQQPEKLEDQYDERTKMPSGKGRSSESDQRTDSQPLSLSDPKRGRDKHVSTHPDGAASVHGARRQHSHGGRTEVQRTARGLVRIRHKPKQER